MAGSYSLRRDQPGCAGHGHAIWRGGIPPKKGHGTIGRALLNGTDVNQRFIVTKPSTNKIGLFGAVVDPGR